MRAIYAAVVVTSIAALCLLLAPAGEAAHKPKSTNITQAKLSLSGKAISATGRVRLLHNTSRIRKRTRVRLVLTGTGKAERYTLKISSKRRFHKVLKTKLTGLVTVKLRVLVKGKRVGRQVRRRIKISAAPESGPLLGTFELKAGSAPQGGKPSGTWFQMLTPSGSPLSNTSSTGGDKNYTPLRPGSDGGLRTTGFQAPPVPAFSGGNALANRIVRPASFFGTNFSVATAATDAQAGIADPLPVVRLDDGKLSGQVTAWVAQWNGQSFNQGTPKPDGTSPAPTTPLKGTYDTDTQEFTLTWKSRILGGPFNGFTGSWHLEGTFAPSK